MKRTGIRSIGEVIGECIHSSQWEEGLLAVRVCEAWDALVIGQVALRDHTLRRSFQNGVLSCRLRSSVVRAHLRPEVESLRSHLNGKLGGDYVKQIKLL